MPRVGDVFQLLSGTLAVPNTTIQSAPYNAQQNDWVTEANSPRPVSAGGTGETTASEARESLGAIGVGDLSGADTKAAVVETDSVVIIDSEDDNTNKRWLVSDITTYMRTISPPTGLNRNRLVNGAFQISQEYTSDTPITATGAYPVDQWKITRTVTPGVITVLHRTDGDPYALQLQPSIDQPTIGSGVWHLSQTIEGNRTSDFHWPFLSGSPAVLRVRVQVNIAGTFGFFIRNNPTTHTYVGTFTLGTEEVGEVVEKIIPIPVPPAGTWATTNAAGITVGFTMAAAAANLAATAGWSASSSVYGVTGQVNLLNSGGGAREISFSAVALYSDPDSTGVAPKWEMPDEAEELIACERYFQKSYAIGVSGGTATSVGAEYWTTICSTTGTDWGALKFRTRMRTTASVTLYAQAGGAAGNVTAQGLTKPGQTGNGSDTGCWVRVNGSSGLTAGTGSMSFQWLASARL